MQRSRRGAQQGGARAVAAPMGMSRGLTRVVDSAQGMQRLSAAEAAGVGGVCGGEAARRPPSFLWCSCARTDLGGGAVG
jgi:hypothetical protein